MFKKSGISRDKDPKTLDMDANMQGRLVFKDPVDLKISGNFEGSLDAKGNLTISEGAVVNAEIKGENINIAGKVIGNISADGKLVLTKTAHVIGDINIPILVIEEGAYLEGNCHMITEEEKVLKKERQILDRKQLAEYLEVDLKTVDEWIENRKVPAFKEDGEWKFDKSKIDAWVASERIK